MNARSALFVLFCSLSACQRGPGGTPGDFNSMAMVAYPEGGKGSKAALDQLWTSLFKLPKWYFLMSTLSAGQHEPSIELVDGRSQFLAFTDLQQLTDYANWKPKVPVPGAPTAAPAAPGALDTNPFAPGTAAPAAPAVAAPSPDADAGSAPNPHLNADGKPLYLEMTPDEACAYFAKYAGPPVAGVRFNDGAPRTFGAPLPTIINIREMLKQEKKL